MDFMNEIETSKITVYKIIIKINNKINEVPIENYKSLFDYENKFEVDETHIVLG